MSAPLTPGLRTFLFATPLRSRTLPARWARVEVDDELRVRFGPWRLRVPRAEIVGAERTGPFSAAKALGVRLSLADLGLTFGTNASQGVCIRFSRARRGIEPFGLIRHPAVTLTVADPDGLIAALGADA